MYCPNCGKKVPEGARFCFECGVQLPITNVQPEEKREEETITPQESASSVPVLFPEFSKEEVPTEPSVPDPAPKEKKQLSSWGHLFLQSVHSRLFLSANILYCVSIFFSFLTAIVSVLEAAFLMDSLPISDFDIEVSSNSVSSNSLGFSVIFLIAIWVLYSAGRSSNPKTCHTGCVLMRVYFMIDFILSIIFGVVFLFGSVICFSFAILESKTAVLILAIGLLLLTPFDILCSICFKKLVTLFKYIELSMLSEEKKPRISGYATYFTLCSGVVLSLASLLALFLWNYSITLSIITALTLLISGISLFLYGIVLLRYRNAVRNLESVNH